LLRRSRNNHSAHNDFSFLIYTIKIGGGGRSENQSKYLIYYEEPKLIKVLEVKLYYFFLYF